MNKIHHAVTVHKGRKSAIDKENVEANSQNRKPDLFAGHTRKYTPLNADGEVKPDENKPIQRNALDVLDVFQKNMTEILDRDSQIEYANSFARADVVVDGVAVLEDVPVTYLLVAEKRLADLRSLVDGVPVLPSDEAWGYDELARVYRTQETRSTSTRKTKRAIVLVEPTDKHPAQAQLIDDDVPQGTWATAKMNAALPVTRKRDLLAKIDKLIGAVKLARASANLTDAPDISAGKKLLGYVFGA